MTTVYLAGGFYKEYKASVLIPGLRDAGIGVIDPEDLDDDKPYPGWFVGRDFAEIDRCDLVLAYRDEYPRVYGMAAEIGYAGSSSGTEGGR